MRGPCLTRILVTSMSRQISSPGSVVDQGCPQWACSSEPEDGLMTGAFMAVYAQEAVSGPVVCPGGPLPSAPQAIQEVVNHVPQMVELQKSRRRRIGRIG